MNKKWTSGVRRKLWRNDSERPLIENNNNNNIQDGYNQAGTGYDNPSAQNTLNIHEDQCLQIVGEIGLKELAELLGVAPDADASEECLIQKSVDQHFPKPPADLDQDLQQHLLNVQKTVLSEVAKLSPLLESTRLMGCLIECYHRHTFDHLHDLLQNISSTRNSFVLMKWVLSQELLVHPELPEMDHSKKDPLLFTEFVEKAKVKLLENVQKEVRGHLEKILQFDRSQKGCDREEAYVGLYVDTIRCAEAMPKETQKISSKLSDLVREVCFQELLIFLRRYVAEQTEILGNKPETIHFFKTLTTCKKLKQHVQTECKGIPRSLLKETVEMLENMEAFTLKLLMEIVANTAESHLKDYFKTENKQFFCLIHAVKTHFSKQFWCQDIQKRVMDEAYKLIAHIYLEHLVRSSQSKLKKSWSPNVEQTITEDAKLLHNTISDLAPDVRQWNLMLLKIPELLESTDTDGLKITVASMQKECLTWSEDLELLPALLRWKGLTRQKVSEVLDALPGHQPRPRSVSGYCCLTCW